MTGGAPTIAAFHADGPLPRGVTLLEASAGTGKTHTIATLVARYVAEADVPLERQLVVTFTRAATGELRDRVRERLKAARAALAAGGPPAGADAALAMLAAVPRDEADARLRRVERALAGFDAATIATHHGFAQQMLDGLGTAGGVDRGTRLIEDDAEIVAAVVDDLYLRTFRSSGSAPFTRDEAMRIATAALLNREAPLEPADAAADGVPGTRRRFAEAVRREHRARLERMRLATYDDQLTRLRDALTDPGRGAAARRRLRERYSVALIDEFQDTDPVQWAIVDAAFGDGDLVLIGDPKQAIYAFRGADVHTYLRAGARAPTRRTLAVNWRTDQGLLDGVAAVFRGAALGDEAIRFQEVSAADPDRPPGLAGGHADAPLRARVLRCDAGLFPLTAKGYAAVAGARPAVARDVAAEAVRLLASGAQVREGERMRPVHPGDIAVLVRTNQQAAMVRDAMARVEVPAVINGAGSVFDTRAAAEWLALLRAVERPSAPRLAAAAALTAFIGWSARRLAAADDDAREELHAHLHGLAATLRRRGVATMLHGAGVGEPLAGRVLARADGERHLTDLRHVAQLLHEAAREGRLGVSALVAWLAGRISDARADTGDEERSRRLESDGHAVQVLTIHRAKGLEFPVVYCPYLWDKPSPRGDAIPVYHDPTARGAEARRIDVGGPGDPGYADRLAAHRAEERGEDLRLAYVALTRARHRAVVWWARPYGAEQSPLGRLLHPGANRVPGDDDTIAALEALAGADVIGVEAVRAIDEVPWRAVARAPAALSAADLGRMLDLRWRRHSFSSVVAPTEDERVASEPEHAARADEPEAPVAARPTDADALAAVALPLADQPAGVGFGSLVHGVLERCDFAAADLPAHLGPLIAEQARRWDVPLDDPDGLAAGLAAALETPLPGGLRLREIARRDRLDELAFELPLAGGERPAGRLVPADIADLLQRRLAADDPLAAYAERLRDPALGDLLRGHLTGTVDLVARTADGRYAVIDYKTNRLGAGALTAADYRPTALAAEMVRAHYPLQALFYLVAVHRYLRWRLPDYAPDRHLAGAGYLFVRGMVGAHAPAADGGVCGVMWWRPPPGLVEALSDLLHEGRR